MDRETSRVVVGIFLIAMGAIFEVVGIGAKTFCGVTTWPRLKTTADSVNPMVGRVFVCAAGAVAIAAGIFFAVSSGE